METRTVMRIFLLFPLLLMGCTGLKEERTIRYDAGFLSTHFVDSSRIYKPDTDKRDVLHYRPIDIDVWYPSQRSTKDTSVTVEALLGLLETRANAYTSSTAGNGIAGQLAKFFSEGFKCGDSATLLKFKTNSFKNAEPVAGKFPLVIYMAAFNGMSYENFTLFETLAARGFIVVSISSIGRYPGDMTTKKEDLMEQVYDALASYKILNANVNIDFNKVGIVGYSWGGLAGVILADNIPGVKCVVSWEGSEFHHYGNEDADFNNIANSPEFASLKISQPYLRFESAPMVTDKKDSVYNFSLRHCSDYQIYTIDSMQHEDFDCFSRVVREAGNCPVNDRYNTALTLTVSYLEDLLKNEHNFQATADNMLNKNLHKKSTK